MTEKQESLTQDEANGLDAGVFENHRSFEYASQQLRFDQVLAWSGLSEATKSLICVEMV